MLFRKPGPGLFASIALKNTIIHVTWCSRAQGGVVEVDQSQRLLNIILEFVQCLQLLRRRRQALTAGRLKEHLIAAAKQSGDLRANKNTGLLDFRLILTRITHHGADAVLGDFHAPVGEILNPESGISQELDPFRECKDLLALAAEEHTI